MLPQRSRRVRLPLPSLAVVMTASMPVAGYEPSRQPPWSAATATFLVKLFTGNQLAMFLVPCAIAGCFILLFAVTLNDRRLAREDKPAWSVREIASTFDVNPRKSPDFAWAFASRLMFVLAYAFLITYQAYYLLEKIGSTVAEVPQQIFLPRHTRPVRRPDRRGPHRWPAL
jgi:hypothetical protein